MVTGIKFVVSEDMRIDLEWLDNNNIQHYSTLYFIREPFSLAVKIEDRIVFIQDGRKDIFPYAN